MGFNAVSAGFWRRLLHGARRLVWRDDWPRFAGPDWADRIMRVPVTDRLFVKQGRSIGRLRLHAGSEETTVFIKRHYRLPWWRGLLALLWPRASWSPAMQEWENLHWARAQGLPTASPVAAGEFIGPWGRLQSFLAVEELHNMLPLHQAVPAAAQQLAPALFRRWKKGLIAEMARLSRELHARRHFHKDLYLCHFYIDVKDTQQIQDWRGRVWMIDFHRLGHHRWTWPWWLAKDLAQLLHSADVPGVEARDLLRFWRAYFGARCQSWPVRLLQRWVRVRAWFYRRHQQRQRTRRARKEPRKAA
jgi:hypothetical protein